MSGPERPIPEPIADAPPSTKYVWEAIKREGPATRAELVEETYYASRTVDRALERLEELDLIERDRDSDDRRYIRVRSAERA